MNIINVCEIQNEPNNIYFFYDNEENIIKMTLLDDFLKKILYEDYQDYESNKEQIKQPIFFYSQCNYIDSENNYSNTNTIDDILRIHNIKKNICSIRKKKNYIIDRI